MAKQHYLKKKTSLSLFKPIAYLSAMAATSFAGWMLIDDPIETNNTLSFAAPPDFASQVTELAFEHHPNIPNGKTATKAISEQNRRKKMLALFGKKLFFDPEFSINSRVSCSTCHNPQYGFTDGLRFSKGVGTTTRNTPTIINSGENYWFFWDGRADSLASQSLGPIEHPDEHGISRTFVVNLIKQKYMKDYVANFQRWPKELTTALPKHALPRPKQLSIPIEVATNGLRTLSVFAELERIMDVAFDKHIAPAQELSHHLTAPPSIDKKWFAAWEALDIPTQRAINQVFRDFGLAIEAYEKGIVAQDSAFDRFASRLAKTKNVENSLGPGFGMEELVGLKIFLGRGNCTNCHSGQRFSDQQFHNTGLAGRSGDNEVGLDIGRSLGVIKTLNDTFNCKGEFLGGQQYSNRQTLESCREIPWLTSNNLELVGAFKTPTLRNISETAPYGHDGRFSTLREVLNHYNDLEKNPAIGHREDTLTSMNIENHELISLEKFLLSLTSKIYDHSTDTTIKQRPL